MERSAAGADLREVRRELQLLADRRPTAHQRLGNCTLTYP